MLSDDISDKEKLIRTALAFFHQFRNDVVLSDRNSVKRYSVGNCNVSAASATATLYQSIDYERALEYLYFFSREEADKTAERHVYTVPFSKRVQLLISGLIHERVLANAEEESCIFSDFLPPQKPHSVWFMDNRPTVVLSYPSARSYIEHVEKGEGRVFIEQPDIVLQGRINWGYTRSFLSLVQGKQPCILLSSVQTTNRSDSDNWDVFSLLEKHREKGNLYLVNEESIQNVQSCMSELSQ